MGTQVRDSYKNAKFYYERASFDIIYINNGGEGNKTASYKYEADISGAGNAYKPTIPPAGKEDYVFAGWYADPTGQTEYKFDGKTMPAQNITVYAKWVPPTYTVTFYDHDDNQVYALTIAKGAKFDESQVPVITLDEGKPSLDGSCKTARLSTLIPRSIGTTNCMPMSAVQMDIGFNTREAKTPPAQPRRIGQTTPRALTRM